MRITPFLRSRSSAFIALALAAAFGAAASPAAAAPVDGAREVPWRTASITARDVTRWKKNTTYGPVQPDRVFPGVEAILYGDGPSVATYFKWPYESRGARGRASSVRHR